MSDIYLSIAETPTVVTLTNPLISSNVAQSVTVTNVVSVSVVTMPAISVSGGLTNAELRASAVTVALDASSLSALEQVTVTVGAAVSISNFPSTQTVAGTVTANIGSEYYSGQSGVTYSLSLQSFTDGGEIFAVGLDDPLPVKIISGSVTVGNSVTIGSLPAISGTVTANNSVLSNVLDYDGNNYFLKIGGRTAGGKTDYPINVSGTVTIGSLPAISGTVTVGNSVTIGSLPAISGTVTVGNSVTIGSLPAISGTVTAVLSFDTIFNDGGDRLNVGLGAVAGVDPANWLKVDGGSVPISGTVTANVELFADTTQLGSSVFGVSGADVNAIRTVIYSSANSEFGSDAGAPVDSTNPLPVTLKRTTWTDYSGSVVTANSAITAISTTERSYLLAQVTTGQMFLNIGATCTTGNGVYFSAGQGFAWETSVPQGIVSIISSVTGTNYVLKDG